ncbi:MAG: Fructose-bisphosphate aldolase class 1 [Alphaproteobacteria bacterium MarineAlpha5_Bin9]|nr:MAG: Fructose-bisphosphate aldolase class 1 [Alphaproteobacteria bacterium MarineAlpha5_Bin9]|tara:strand:- start:10451 stop:11353 length:903 start_codon:yes stop_codon:yes gene_type:complete
MNEVDKIISNYEDLRESSSNNLSKLLNFGKLAGTGKLIIYPVDQGFEHGPDRSFSINPDAYDPHYHINFAIESGMSAFAAPLGMIESGYKTYENKIPFILKCNSSNSLTSIKDQAITGSVEDALRLKCIGVGFTIYPGSDYNYKLIQQACDLFREAKNAGLITVLWSYARGSMSKKGETAINIISYAAHMACLCGAHIVKVKLPTSFLEEDPTKDVFIKNKLKIDSPVDRVRLIKKSCFNGKRIVVFSGGEAKTDNDILNEVKAINEGGGNGSIVGRNCFQRKKNDALSLINQMFSIYKS